MTFAIGARVRLTTGIYEDRTSGPSLRRGSVGMVVGYWPEEEGVPQTEPADVPYPFYVAFDGVPQPTPGFLLSADDIEAVTT